MKFFSNILQQFSSSQRLVVLILLLIFTSSSFVASQYLKTDNCRPLIEENLRMQEDLIKISEILRKERLKQEKISQGLKQLVVTLDTFSSNPTLIESFPSEMNSIDSAILISESFKSRIR